MTRKERPSGKQESVGDVGEFALIDRIAAIAGPSSAVVGIGDDAAVIDQPGEHYLLATIDMLVENVHFRRSVSSPREIGQRAAAVNISDIAAMGGEPTYALVSLALPPDTATESVDQVYRGLVAELGRFGASVIGGNFTRIAGPLAIDIALLGQVPKDQLLRRSGARLGDILAVTGRLGAQAAIRLARAPGSRMRLLRTSSARTGSDYSSRKYVPEPRVAAARALAERHLAHAMIDISDGLAADLHHLCRASAVGAIVVADQVPISPLLELMAVSLEQNALELALTGGEDYELLVAIGPESVEQAQLAVGEVGLQVIGSIVSAEEGIRLVGSDGDSEILPPEGWTHF